jgi:hypothetical protein
MTNDLLDGARHRTVSFRSLGEAIVGRVDTRDERREENWRSRRWMEEAEEMGRVEV